MNEKPTLFSYIIPHDGGSAPNPYHGICTLVICKPVIRRTAKVGDWVVGLGAKDTPIGDASGKVVYAMKITKKISMEEYDTFCKENYPEKIPDWDSGEYMKRIGDCIYDFSNLSNPKIRKAVHTEKNMKTDLGGEYALLSTDFYYFGDKPNPLPNNLIGIVKQGQGYRSKSNDEYVDDFIDWIRKQKTGIIGEPQKKKEILSKEYNLKCSQIDLKEAEEDEEIGQDNC
jgi:hypothetical protein